MPSLGGTGSTIAIRQISTLNVCALLASRIWPQHGPSFRARQCQVHAIGQKSSWQLPVWARLSPTHLRCCLLIMNGTPAGSSQGCCRLYLILLPSRRSSWVPVGPDGLKENTNHLQSSTRHPGENHDREFLKCDRQKMWGSQVMPCRGSFDPPNHFHTFRPGFCCVAGQQEAKKTTDQRVQAAGYQKQNRKLGCQNF